MMKMVKCEKSFKIPWNPLYSLLVCGLISDCDSDCCCEDDDDDCDCADDSYEYEDGIEETAEVDRPDDGKLI